MPAPIPPPRHRPLTPSRGALAVALSLAACGNERWTADLPSDPSAPIAVRSVTARRSFVAILGPSPVALGSDTAKNSVSFELDVVVQRQLPAGAMLGTRSACAVDGVVWATAFNGNSELPGAPSDDPRTVSTSSFLPNPFAAGPPTACELTYRMQPGRIGPDFPDFEPVDLGRLCWTAEGITATACSDAALPRTTPDTTVAIESVRAQWHPGQATTRGAPGGLAFAAHVIVGADAERENLTAAAACIRDGAPLQSRAVVLETLRDFAPGDTFAMTGAAFEPADFPSPPARCTIEIRHRDRSPLDGGRFVPLASACLDGDQVTAGACPGLSPGPATVRIEGRHATIERGAHREGPFAIDDEGAWDRVVRSVKATRDEAIVIVAPPTLAQAELVGLVDAAKAAALPSTIAVP